MKMTRFEKALVNRERKGEGNAARVRDVLEALDPTRIRDALELGCGIGVVSAFLSETYGMNVTGTDYDPAQVELAKQRSAETDRLRFQTADAANLTFEDGSFDLVVSQNVFHHIPNWPGAAREVARVLRPDGILIWHDLSVRPSFKPLFRVLSRFMGLYTFAHVEAAFSEHGLDIQTREHMSHGPFQHHFLTLRKIES